MARTAMPKTKSFGGKTYFLYNNIVLSSDEADKFVAKWRKISPRHQAKKIIHFAREGYVVYIRETTSKSEFTFLQRKRAAERRKPDTILLPGMPEFEIPKSKVSNLKF